MRFIHLTGRNCLIVIPEPDCVGGGLGRACAVPWLPAGLVCCARFLQERFKYVSCELDQLSGRYLIYRSLVAKQFG